MILTAISIVGIFLIIIGVLIFYAYRNPNMKERKDGSFNPLGYDRLDIAFVYILAILLIAAGIAAVTIIVLLP